jgi:CSLREA domain-containing protein
MSERRFGRWPATALVVAVALVTVLLLLSAPSTARAASFTVDSIADAVDANPGDGACGDLTGKCTLRAAIMETNALAGADTIVLPAGTYTLAIAGAGEDAAATGDLDITDEVTITGAGQSTTIIDGGGVDRVIHVLIGSHADIAGVTVQNGVANEGGGIWNFGTLTLIDSTVSGNSAVSGGGIYTFNIDQIATITGSTVSGNATSNDGGGITNSGGTLDITNSTVSSNSGLVGGGIYSDGTAEFINTIIADSPFGGDCSGAGFTSLGHNLDSDGSCGLAGVGNRSAVDPLLGPLADNGGPTLTHALLPGSPAIDAVPVADCTEAGGSPLITDQRGERRPQGAACDIGAYEAAPPLGGFVGSAPGPGGRGLLVTSENSNADGLAVALESAGCDVETLAIL